MPSKSPWIYIQQKLSIIRCSFWEFYRERDFSSEHSTDTTNVGKHHLLRNGQFGQRALETSYIWGGCLRSASDYGFLSSRDGRKKKCLQLLILIHSQVSSSGTQILTEPVLRYLNRKMSEETTSSPRALK